MPLADLDDLAVPANPEIPMTHAEWIVALPFWLLGAPLVLALFDLMRTRAGRR